MQDLPPEQPFQGPQSGSPASGEPAGAPARGPAANGAADKPRQALPEALADALAGGAPDEAHGAPPPIPPVDVDGVRTVLVGTILFAVGFVVTLLLRNTLGDSGRQWWMWTCLAGAGLGLLGFEYTRHRRDSLTRHGSTAGERAAPDEERPPDAHP